VNEKSQIQALERKAPLLPPRENISVRQTSDYERHGTTTLFAALNVLPKKPIPHREKPCRNASLKMILRVERWWLMLTLAYPRSLRPESHYSMRVTVILPSGNLPKKGWIILVRAERCPSAKLREQVKPRIMRDLI
jgi:hypothetical protein